MFIIRHISFQILQLLDRASVFKNIRQLFFLSYIIGKFCFASFVFLMSQLIILPKGKRRESPPAPVAKPCDGSAWRQPALLVPTNLFDPTLFNLYTLSRKAVLTHQDATVQMT